MADPITFVFTDIEGSTRRWEERREAMRASVRRHDLLLRDAVASHGGRVFKTVGDAFCAAFGSASDAVAAAIDAQRAMAGEPWPDDLRLQVRVAIHTGVADEVDGDYFGPPVNRVARLMAAGHGGQTLLSGTTESLIRDSLPPEVTLRDMGKHRLKDLAEPEHIFEIVIAGLPADFPPLETLDYRPNNLPIQPTPFVGRDREVAAVQSMLADPAVRLLTLVGPGGIGKTRLALQAAAEALDHFPDGATFVPLAPLSDPALVGSTIAGALGLQEESDRPLAGTLTDYLRSKQLLLILDNMEHLLAAVPLVAQLQASCPRLTILVTSRAPLRLSGEREYPVPSLALPDLRHLPDLDTVTHFDSVALFVERAQGVRPDFALTADTMAPVAEICARLDGLPLAIELAAARVRLFPPAALLMRLSNRLGMLTGGSRDLPSRQQTLRGAIDWSYSLLAPAERTLFARLAVFAGGCTVEAAEAVCDADLSGTMIDDLTSLVEKSLVREDGAAEPRFRMLETIREYGLDVLHISGEEAELRRRHTDYYVELVEGAAAAFHNRDEERFLASLDLEHDNMRAALAWSLGDGAAPELALRLVAGLHQFWQIRGFLTEGRSWLEQVLARTEDAHMPARVAALIGAGWLAFYQDDLVAARAHLGAALDLARSIADRSGEAAAHYGLGCVAETRGDYPEARREYESSVEIYRSLGDVWGMAAGTNDLGMLALHEGDYEQAVRLLEEGLSLARRLGQRRAIAILLVNLGYVRWTLGEYERAKMMYSESLVHFREVGDKLGTARTLDELALVTQRMGDDHTAAELVAESLTLFRELGHSMGQVEWIENQARIAAMRGDAERAALLHGAAAAFRQSVGVPLSPTEQAVHDRDLEPGRAALGERWQRIWEDGKTLTLERAIERAVTQPAGV